MTSSEKRQASPVVDNYIKPGLVNDRLKEIHASREKLLAEVNRIDGLMINLRQQRERLAADIAAHDGAVQALTALLTTEIADG